MDKVNSTNIPNITCLARIKIFFFLESNQYKTKVILHYDMKILILIKKKPNDATILFTTKILICEKKKTLK